MGGIGEALRLPNREDGAVDRTGEIIRRSANCETGLRFCVSSVRVLINFESERHVESTTERTYGSRGSSSVVVTVRVSSIMS